MRKAILSVLKYAWIPCMLLSGVESFSFYQTTPNLEKSGFDGLAGTSPLLSAADISSGLLEEAHSFIEKKIHEAATQRGDRWKRDFSSLQQYEKSIEPNRRRFRQYLGIEDKTLPVANYNLGLPDRHPGISMEQFSAAGDPILVAETSKYRIFQVRWPVLNRVQGEGLLLQPKTNPVAHVIVIPDADQTPEQMAGLTTGIAPSSQMARNLAENGMQVLIPVLIDRGVLFEGKPHQQTRREWIHKQAFHMGKHLIGYEVQKVIAAIDWFSKTYGKDIKMGVAGYLEGGLIAMYTAAIDTRIDVTMVSGYFQSRENVWNEPIYRNVWGILEEFGDAEIATMIAPRSLIVEYSLVPDIWDGTKVEDTKTPKHTGYKGRISMPPFKAVQTEYDRIGKLLKPSFQKRELIDNGKGEAVALGSGQALSRFSNYLGKKQLNTISGEIPVDSRKAFDPDQRQFRQAKELDDHVQGLLHVSDYQRNNFFLDKVMPEFSKRTWSTKIGHPYYSAAPFIEKTNPYRTVFAREIIGEFDEPLSAPQPQSRKIYDTERWVGHEVRLKVYDQLSAAGVLLLPKDLKSGEKRPVVVLQHGRNGVPNVVIEGSTSYNNMGALLADRGFIVFVPYGIYNGEDRYRWLNRKANTVRKTLFSFSLAQHKQILSWLGTLPNVDKDRIAFYGKSYGGEMAMRIPSILEGYCLSICSGDFGDWSRKVADSYSKISFMNTIEWEMPYFNMGSTFSYAEMAYLIFPRPFMVERGHDDLVQPDEWVAHEYAKVKYLYSQFNMKDKTDIEYFNGGHASRNEGTFKFLHKHLNWP